MAPYLPDWLKKIRVPAAFGDGCYWAQPGRSFVWIAANELPLRKELLPFLVARSDRALDEFARWAAQRRPLEWLLSMPRYLPMSTTVREDLLWLAQTDDPEIQARDKHIIDVLLAARPQVKAQLVEEARKEAIEKGIERGHLAEARTVLRRVIARRSLVLGPEDDARIDTCTDLATLERWIDQAVTTSSGPEALL